MIIKCTHGSVRSYNVCSYGHHSNEMMDDIQSKSMHILIVRSVVSYFMDISISMLPFSIHTSTYIILTKYFRLCKSLGNYGNICNVIIHIEYDEFRYFADGLIHVEISFNKRLY